MISNAVTDEYLRVKGKYAHLIKIGSSKISEVHKFTGVEIARERDKGTVTLKQKGYINELHIRYKGRAVESHFTDRASAQESG